MVSHYEFVIRVRLLRLAPRNLNYDNVMGFQIFSNKYLLSNVSAFSTSVHISKCDVLYSDELHFFTVMKTPDLSVLSSLTITK